MKLLIQFQIEYGSSCWLFNEWSLTNDIHEVDKQITKPMQSWQKKLEPHDTCWSSVNNYSNIQFLSIFFFVLFGLHLSWSTQHLKLVWLNYSNWNTKLDSLLTNCLLTVTFKPYWTVLFDQSHCLIIFLLHIYCQKLTTLTNESDH